MSLKFQQLVTTANQVAVKFNGARDTCVLTSFALHDVLQRLGYKSRPLRIEAAVFPDDRKLYGNILGRIEPGPRRAAAPDKWWGHLAVLVEDEWLLDPTLDQANKKEWPRSMRVGPLAVRLTKQFWAEYGSILIRTNGCSVNFPSRHPLNQSFRRSVISQADVILAIEMNDVFGSLNAFSDRIARATRPTVKKGAKIITLGLRDTYMKSNYQDFGRYQDVDLAIAGDGEASLALLIEAVKRLIDPSRKSAYDTRGKKLAAAHQAMVEQTKSDATLGWDASPITTARMCAEVYAQIKDEDWSMVGTSIRLSWPHRLWNFDKPYRWNGVSGGAGVGYNLPASLGAALSGATATSCSRQARYGRPHTIAFRCSTSCRTIAPTIRNTCT
jgi:hypothetical protein